MSFADVPAVIVEDLRLDLVSLMNDHPFANDLLPESPRRWYLTGSVVPTSLPTERKQADEREPQLATAGKVCPQ